MIAVDDVAVFVTMAFERPGHWQLRAVDLAGDEMSVAALAESFGRMIGRNVQYAQVSWEPFEETNGPEMAAMYKWFQDVGYSVALPRCVKNIRISRVFSAGSKCIGGKRSKRRSS